MSVIRFLSSAASHPFECQEAQPCSGADGREPPRHIEQPRRPPHTSTLGISREFALAQPPTSSTSDIGRSPNRNGSPCYRNLGSCDHGRARRQRYLCRFAHSVGFLALAFGPLARILPAARAIWDCRKSFARPGGDRSNKRLYLARVLGPQAHRSEGGRQWTSASAEQ
jgi:hypothetical protein